MRIGIFTDAYYPNISGVVTSVMTLEKGLRALGHEVFIFTTDPVNPTDRIDDPHIVYFSGLKVPLKKLETYRLALQAHLRSKIVKKYKLDVIHLNTEFSMARFATICARRYHIPLVYTFHTLYEDYLSYISKTIDDYFHDTFLLSLAKMMISPINKRAIIKIVPSRKTLANISKYYIDGDVRVVPTGIDLNKLVNKKVSNEELVKLREELNIPKDDVIYLYLGRISPEKNIELLIESFAEAIKINNNQTFIIVGDGEHLKNLKELANSLNIGDKIKFTGFVEWENIVPYYQLADAFLNASVSETQGLTYVESLACGTPIIVKRDEVLEGVVLEGINGYYYDTKEELVNLLVNYTTDPTPIRELKDKTFDTVNKFNDSFFVNSLYNIYCDAIQKAKNK